MKKRLLVIVGPTAAGKTELSIQLAKRFHGEIVSGDSMQVYRGLDIGTAKVSEEEMQGIPHYMIDIKDPHESFSVTDFQREARTMITNIHERGKLPILVGGTGLYVHAITHDYKFTKIGANQAFRKKLETYAEKYGNEALHQKLKQLDPQSYQMIHPNNRKRVIRALEVIEQTGKPFSSYRQKQIKPVYNAIYIGLTMDREMLYQRINSRVDKMIENGLFEEAYRLYQQNLSNSQAAQAIGYKELFLYFSGKISKEEAIQLLKRNSRRYAKRQYTWFKNKMKIVWFDMTKNPNKKKQEIFKYVAGKLHCLEKPYNIEDWKRGGL